MAQECGFDEGAECVLFVGVELVDGFEVVAEVCGESFVIVGEGVDGCQGGGDAAQDVEGGLAAPRVGVGTGDPRSVPGVRSRLRFL